MWATALALAVYARSVTAVSYTNLQPGAAVQLSTTSLQYSGQLVLVSWSGIQNPTINDAVLLLVPANTSLLNVFPVKYRWVGQSSTYRTGSGSFTFKVINERSNAQFLYARNVTIGTNGTVEWNEDDDVTGFLDTNIVATSPVLTLAAPNEPTHVHMSYTQNEGEILTQWITRDAGTPTVQYGLATGNYTSSATGNYSTYTRSDMCGAPANTTGYLPPGIMNNALMSKLPASSRIYYRIGDPTFGFSPEYSVLTPALVGPNSEVYFIAWADSGQATDDMTNEWDWLDSNPLVTAPYNTRAQKNATVIDVWQQDEAQQGASLDLTQRVATEVDTGRNVTLFIFNGDISYARGSVGQWDTFGDQYQPIFSQVPVMMLPGNHERDWPNTGDRFYPLVNADDSGGECGFAYGKRFIFPQPSFDQQWYTFAHGPITFLQISTEQPFGAGSPQWIWIVNTLQSVNRTRTPWVVVGIHRPIYTSSMYGNNFKSDVNVAEDLRNSLEEVFYQYQVDMTWAGHVHLYERTCPVLKRTCLGYNATDGTANAPVHISMGNGGFEFTWFANPTPPPYWDSNYMEHGFNRVYANGTYIHMQSVESDTGRVVDEFSLVKPAGWTPNYKGRLNQLYYFFSNYTEQTWWEKGINTDAWWTTPIYLPATEIFEMNPALVDMLSITNTTLLQNINAADSVVDLAQIFQVYQAAFNDPNFYKVTPLPGVASTYLKEAIQPLLQLYINNAARSQVDPSFDPATFVATKNAGAPAAGLVKGAKG